ncbi:hypothetical protein [Nocardia seriolae]|nr:hypothetical protein [Nocardia seriolae]MTJ65455.1 hypothetical protein [Nocardia seriolae]MTJ70880.1 hypothetical protein [Nocardia seriolae]MTJ90341.1 hypothetical protein [Nocardia seriolae]MTK34302.1 hypothetical protein [Nocardia seriolae]MTK43442.1 hypothetical protein [Nocardia seriolae]
MRLEINRRRWIALLIMLGVLTAAGVMPGLWAVVAPESFYNSFPGLGLHWVRADGPYNHHLVGDAGAFFLALAAITAAALYYRDSVIARIAGLAWLVFGVPHFIYHAFHRPDALSGFSFTLELLAALALPALGLAVLLVAPRERFPVPEPAPFTVKFPRR